MKRLVIVAVLAALLMLLAIPAMAQSGGDADPLTWEALGTVAGASIAAGVIVQVAGLIIPLSARAKRVIAVLSGLVLVVAVTVTTSAVTVAVVGLAAYNGMLAGLAASQAAQVLSHGLNARVTDPPR